MTVFQPILFGGGKLMYRKNKPEKPEDENPEKVYSLYDSDVPMENGSAVRKKPLMERLGLIEPINLKNNIQPLSGESEAATSTVKPATDENGDLLDLQEKTDKNQVDQLTINEIYNKYNLESYETNTVYIIESFLKALPNNLPMEVKRQSILNLITASRMDIGYLLKDGIKRLDVLDKYYQNFSANVDDIIATNERHIRKLQERIAYHKKIIEDRLDIKEQQKSEIEFEIQKIANIIDFVEEKK